jgi:hypothetical protein
MKDEIIAGLTPDVIADDPNVARHLARRRDFVDEPYEQKDIHQLERMEKRERIGIGLTGIATLAVMTASTLGIGGAGSAAAVEARRTAPNRPPPITHVASAKNEEPRIEASHQTDSVVASSNLEGSRETGDIGDVLAERVTGIRQDGKASDARRSVTESMTEQVAEEPNQPRGIERPITDENTPSLTPPKDPSVAQEPKPKLNKIEQAVETARLKIASEAEKARSHQIDYGPDDGILL